MDFASLVAVNLPRPHRSERMDPRSEDRYYGGQGRLPRPRLLQLAPAATTAALLLLVIFVV